MCLSFFNKIASNLRLVGTITADMPYDMTTITFHNYQSDQINNFYQLKISRNGTRFFSFFYKTFHAVPLYIIKLLVLISSMQILPFNSRTF